MVHRKVLVMESEQAFFLENASWPVLLVNLSGEIRGASRGALRAFGPGVERGNFIGEQIWCADNDRTPEEFLSDWGSLPDSGVALRLKARDRAVHTFVAQLCPMEFDGKDWLLLQFFEKTPDSKLAATIPAGGLPGAGGEVAVAQKQKLECALHLIRTASMDFNNALTSLLGHTSLLLAQAEPSHPWRGSLLEMEKSARRAAEATQDLADFSRAEKEGRALQVGNLNEVLRKTVEVLQRAHPNAATWDLKLEARPLAVAYDEAKMQQALMKVFENSIEAFEMPGRITVQTSNVRLSASDLKPGGRLAPGSYYRVEVTDNGPGIAPNVLPRIFDPFFTTKQASGHRGLGLVLAYGIVTTLGGAITVTSEGTRGTTVRLDLPAQERAIADEAARGGDLRGNQTILMVDDEELILSMAQIALPTFGYRVFTAANGQKALEIFEQKREEIDVVVTDLVMPLMNGRDLIERLRGLSPGVKVICASGIVRPAAGEERHHLRKPFTCQELVRKIKEVLEGEPTAVR